MAYDNATLGNQDELDYTQLAGMTQEQMNAALLQAALKRGDQSMKEQAYADYLKKSNVAPRATARGHGIVGELNDALATAMPGLQAMRANRAAADISKSKEAFMADVLRNASMQRARQGMQGTPGIMPQQQAMPGMIPSADGQPQQQPQDYRFLQY